MKYMENRESLWCRVRQLFQLETNLIHSYEDYFVWWSHETMDKALYILRYVEVSQIYILSSKHSHLMEVRQL